MKTALTYARAGVDVVAPSDMMDGRVGAIRARARRRRLHQDRRSCRTRRSTRRRFYGPFREAADSTPSFGDRRTYQMDPANGREALREVALDIAEGADIVMVKPALAYMDLIRRVRDSVDVPVACYNVSGEYAMVKAAAERGWIDEERIVDEMLTGFARAGADIIITYFAKDYLRRNALRRSVAGVIVLAGGEATRLPGKLVSRRRRPAAARARVPQRLRRPRDVDLVQGRVAATRSTC